MNILELSEQEINRRNSLDEIRALGIDPYPAAEFPTNAFSTDIKALFNDDEAEPRQVCIAGRLMSKRVMGKASFAELKDSKGRIQVYITRDDICPGEDKELYNTLFKRLINLAILLLDDGQGLEALAQEGKLRSMDGYLACLGAEDEALDTDEVA